MNVKITPPCHGLFFWIPGSIVVFNSLILNSLGEEMFTNTVERVPCILCEFLSALFAIQETCLWKSLICGGCGG